MRDNSRSWLIIAFGYGLVIWFNALAAASSQVIRVPQDMADLQQAIDASSKEATIQVAAGTYYGNFQVSGNRSLIGENPQTTILTDDGEGPPDAVMTIAGDCTLSGFTITGTRGAGLGHAVMISRGSPRIINNIIRDNSFTGLGIHSEVQPTLAVITGNKIYGNGGAGIANYGQYSKSLIEGNEVYSNINVGIVSTYFASPIIKQNYVHHNGVGIVVRDDSMAVIAQNNVIANKLVGINVMGNSSARIVNNSSTSNGTVGINVDRRSKVELFRNTIMDNGAEAIFVKGKSDIVVDSNTVAGNLPTIFHVDESRARISNNSFYSTESPGNNAILLTRARVLVGNNEVVGGIDVRGTDIVDLSKEQMIYKLGQEPFWKTDEGLALNPLPPFDPPVSVMVESLPEVGKTDSESDTAGPDSVENETKAEENAPSQKLRLKGCLGIF
jgi:hypothetical protein